MDKFEKRGQKSGNRSERVRDGDRKERKGGRRTMAETAKGRHKICRLSQCTLRAFFIHQSAFIETYEL